MGVIIELFGVFLQNVLPFAVVLNFFNMICKSLLRMIMTGGVRV